MRDKKDKTEEWSKRGFGLAGADVKMSFGFLMHGHKDTQAHIRIPNRTH